ncbi:MAG: hypothetical protein GY769_24695 [bacterium]|nr:hypothetical protein [bacterium]
MDEGNQVFPPGSSAALLVIEFPSFRDFIDAYSPMISEEGIFIRNADVSESNAFSVGDRVDFEVRLKDDFRLIQGSGEVAWLGSAEAADGAAGTAIRFHDVDAPSQRLISRLVGNYVRDGGKLFEVGGPAADLEAMPAPDAGGDAEALESAAQDELSAGPRLTAETLQASEADALFATQVEDLPEAPLEFESVSPDEVEPSDLGPEALDDTDDGPPEIGFGLEEPIGLETIAIPSGLVADLADEAQAGADEPGAAEPERPESPPADLEGFVLGEPAEQEVGEPGPLQEQVELPSIAEGIAEGEAALEAVEDLDGADSTAPIEAPLEEDLAEVSREGTAEPLQTDLDGSGGFPSEIAQVAEELSGVHQYDPPADEEASSVTYAGSASVRSERNTGGRIAAIVVTFLLLGAGAFYFGDTIRGFLGMGGGADDPEMSEMVRAGEAMPVPAVAPSADDSGEAKSSASEGSAAVDSVEGAVELPTSEAVVEGVPAAGDRPATSRPEPRPAALDPLQDEGGVRRVERITWREVGESTVITVRSDTEFSKASVETVRIRGGAPRVVIKIQGVETAYSPNAIAIGNRHVLRLRTGLHRVDGGSSLHVVADLASADVSILSVEPKGRNLEITLS